MDIGIDLGTTTVIIYFKDKGAVLSEPSVVAINRKTDEVVAVGEEAYRMLGKAPDRLQVIKPMSDGVISDYAATEVMIKFFLHKVFGNSIIKPRVSICVPSQITEVESKAVVDSAALGNTKPDNTSAIIALQKASSVPMELTRQNFYQCVEDLGRIWLDQMRAYYGVRYVDLKPTEEEKLAAQAQGIPLEDTPRPTEFDFGVLNDMPLSIKLDVGGSAYWSEIAQMNTLDNLLLNGQINVVDYLERVPNGYIANQQELIDTLRQRLGMVQTAQAEVQPQGAPAAPGQQGAAQSAGFGPLLDAVQQAGGGVAAQ